jgi:hypothetical protein
VSGANRMPVRSNNNFGNSNSNQQMRQPNSLMDEPASTTSTHRRLRKHKA